MLIYAGLDGIDKHMKCPDPVNVNLYTADEALTSMLEKLPESLEEADELAKRSEFVRSVLPEKIIESLN